MGVLKHVSGFESTLTQNLDSDDDAVLHLCDAEYLLRELKVGDYTYLLLGDGVNTGTVKVTRRAMNLTVEHIDRPKIWPRGSTIYFGTNQYLLEDMIETAVADRVGDTLTGIESDSPETIGVSVENRIAKISFKGSNGGGTVPDFCGLEVGSATHYVGCDGDGNLIRAAVPTMTSGGASVSGGTGIEVSATGVVSLSSIHSGYKTNVTTVDQFGRVVAADNATSGGSSSPFSGDIDWPSGEFTPLFTVTNGTVVAVEKGAASGGGGGAEYAAGDGLTERESGGTTVFDLEEITANETAVDNMVFNKYGQLVQVEDKEDEPQRFTKQPFSARMEVDLVHGQDDGFDVKFADNLTVEEVQRFSDQVDYQFTFDTASPDEEYVVVASGFGRMASKLTKTAGGFLMRVSGYDIHGWMPLSIIVQGSMIDPPEATVYGYNPPEKP